MKSIVLDTSALFTLIENEPGVADIEHLIQEALEERCRLYLSIVAEIELFYISVQEQGEDIAKERLDLLNDLPVHIMELAEDLVQTIGRIKSQYSMSFADCCIAGLAESLDAELVHKDPEYEQMSDRITLKPLPYKSTKNHT